MAATFTGFFSKGDDDALADPKALGKWLDEQPSNDDLGLQEAMIRLLEDAGARHAKVTPARVQAVLELDRHSLALQSRHVRQYLHPSLSEPVRQRLWHANDDLARWFAYLYEHMFAGLDELFLKSRAKSLAPPIAARLFHYRGVQAKHALFRYELWTAGRWLALHEAYAAAIGRDAARTRYSPDPQAPLEEQLSAEEEYLQILLLERVNSGNLTAAQVEVVASWLAASAHLLALAPPPLEGNGFWLDLGLGDGLLVQKPVTPQGPLFYLDVTPLHVEIEKGMKELAAIAGDSPTRSHQVDASNRLALLRRIDPLLRPEAKPIERRGTRTATDRPVTVAVGLAEIASALHSARGGTSADARRRAPRGEAPARRAGSRSVPAESGEVIEYGSAAAENAGWRMYDTSDSGCRLVSQEAARQKLGSVLGLQDEGDDRWKIGIVRRMKNLAVGRGELGVELIALQSLLVSPRPLGGRDAGYSVDGVDIGTDHRGFDALYLPPSSGGRDPPRRSMLVPAAEYGEGRRVFLNLGNSGYTVEFSTPLEQAKDWVWTNFSVISRTE